MRKSNHSKSWLLFLAGLFLLPSSALATDTVETWDPGATDLELYMGMEGFNHQDTRRSVFADILVGYGLIKGLSAYAGMTLYGHGQYLSGDRALYLGLFGTPLDSKHFDVDLFLDVKVNGAGNGAFELSPALELNLDADPKMQSYGAYLRMVVPLSGDDNPDSSAAIAGSQLGIHLDATLGAYWTIVPNYQLLVECNTGFLNINRFAPWPFSTKSLSQMERLNFSLGFNAVLSDQFELIPQITMTLPSQNEAMDFSAMIGMIVTLPSAK